MVNFRRKKALSHSSSFIQRSPSRSYLNQYGFRLSFIPGYVGCCLEFILAIPLKPPADTSNRFNRLRLWWFATSAPHRFEQHYAAVFWKKPTIIVRLRILRDVFTKPQQYTEVFPWMKGDEVDNMGRFWTRKEK